MDELNIAEEHIADRYQVIRHLGEGAMGSVYLAADTQLNRQVALKVLRGEWVSRPEVAKRLELECQLMAQLGPHNNIVTLFDRVNHGDSVVLVIEYVAGENVADVLDRAREMNKESESSRKTTPVLAGISSIALTPDDAIDITLQCLSGLDFAHSRGVIHRDIKPANIMVSHDHNANIVAKITDFGIGKAIAGLDGETAPAFTALTRAGGPGPGTPAYMAPEQIDQKRFGQVGPASDLYALGVTLYEMLSLGLPFRGTYTELLHFHTNVEAPDLRTALPGLSPSLAAVVRKSLAKEQKDRFESAYRFRMELAAAAREPVPAWSPGMAVEDRPSKVPLVFGAIAAIALSAGGYFYVMGSSSSSDTEEAPRTETEVVSESTPAPSTTTSESTDPTSGDMTASAPEQTEPIASESAAVPPAEVVLPPAPVVATPVANIPAVDPSASTQAAKNSAENARSSALDRFGGNAPTNNGSYTKGQEWLAKAAASEASGDYDSARSSLLQATQSFNVAKPESLPKAAPVAAQKAPPKVSPPAPVAQAPKSPPKQAEPEPPKKQAGGGFKPGKTTVTHTNP